MVMRPAWVAAAPAGPAAATAVIPAADMTVTTRTANDLRAPGVVRVRAEVTNSPSDVIEIP